MGQPVVGRYRICVARGAMFTPGVPRLPPRAFIQAARVPAPARPSLVGLLRHPEDLVERGDATERFLNAVVEHDVHA